jgi:hypothetical protein
MNATPLYMPTLWVAQAAASTECCLSMLVQNMGVGCRTIVFAKAQIGPNSGKCDPHTVLYHSTSQLQRGHDLALTKTVCRTRLHARYLTCKRGIQCTQQLRVEAVHSQFEHVILNLHAVNEQPIAYICERMHHCNSQKGASTCMEQHSVSGINRGSFSTTWVQSDMSFLRHVNKRDAFKSEGGVTHKAF